MAELSIWRAVLIDTAISSPKWDPIVAERLLVFYYILSEDLKYVLNIICVKVRTSSVQVTKSKPI